MSDKMIRFTLKSYLHSDGSWLSACHDLATTYLVMSALKGGASQSGWKELVKMGGACVARPAEPQWKVFTLKRFLRVGH